MNVVIMKICNLYVSTCILFWPIRITRYTNHGPGYLTLISNLKSIKQTLIINEGAYAFIVLVLGLVLYDVV